MTPRGALSRALRFGWGCPSAAPTRGARAFPKYDPFWWATFLASNLVLSVTALSALGLDKEKPAISWPVALLGIAFALLSVPITYGIGGRWRYASLGWRFWQPFLGGCPFVLVQSVAWIFFAASLLPLFLLLVYALKSGSDRFNGVFNAAFSAFFEYEFLLLSRGVLFSIGWCVFLSEVLMIASLLLFSVESCENSSTHSADKNESKMKQVVRDDSLLSSSTHALLLRPSRSCLEHSSRQFRTLMGFNLTVATFSCLLAAAYDIWIRWDLASTVNSVIHIESHLSQSNCFLAGLSIFCALSLCTVVFLTHVVGGVLQCRHLCWSFWQPFSGGLEFVLIQAVAWSLFGFSLLTFSAVAYGAMNVLQFRNVFFHPLLASAGFTGFASEILLFSSLLIFKSESTKSQSSFVGSVTNSYVKPFLFFSLASSPHHEANEKNIKRKGKRLKAQEVAPRSEAGMTFRLSDKRVIKKDEYIHDFRCSVVEPTQWTCRQKLLAVNGPLNVSNLTLMEVLWWIRIKMRSILVMCFIYLGHYIFCLLILIPFFFFPFNPSIILSIFILSSYLVTYFDDAHKTGGRTSKCVQDTLVPFLEESARLHFGEIKIVRESNHPYSSSNKYIFCYHPHGLFPATMSWIMLTKAWKELFKDVIPASLVASVVFRVPILRDLNLWAGAREVSKSVFEQTLNERNAVILCPGGQSELSYHLLSTSKQIVLCGRKKGFVRMALEADAYLVPMFSFGESTLFDNFIHWPSAQRFSYKRFGFPIPFLPVGLGHIFPLPRATKLTLVVGRPIKFRKPKQLPLERTVNVFHGLYYERVKQLFQYHKNEHGFEDWKLSIDFGDGKRITD